EEHEEELEEELEVDAEEDAPPAATPPIGSPITPPPLLESSSDSKVVALVVTNRTHEMHLLRLREDIEMLFSNVKYLERSEKRLQNKIDANSSRVRLVERRNALDQDLSHEVQITSGVKGRVARLEDNDQEKMDKTEKIEKRFEMLETNYASVLSDRDRLEREFYCMRVWVSERLGCGAMDACPDDSIDVLDTLGSLSLSGRGDHLVAPSSYFILLFCHPSLGPFVSSTKLLVTVSVIIL
nr:hypothetical protein [Tanacetum cinerariifolium]